MFNVGEENFLKKDFLPRTPSFKNFATERLFFAVISALDSQNTFLKFLSHKKSLERDTFHKADLPAEKSNRSTSVLFVLLFTRLTRYSVLHLSNELSSDNKPPLCKGRWLAKQDGGIVKSKILQKNNPSAAFGVSSLYTREPLICAPRKSVNFPDKHCFCGQKSDSYSRENIVCLTKQQ